MLKLLVIGGPRHGETMGFEHPMDRDRIRRVPFPAEPVTVAASYSYDIRPSYRVALYKARIVADRLVWVYLGE